uniref:SAM domain-containing protein n=1 Tax=Rhizophora mucronata TaxID=61149 RepID=A0A2P2IPL5_RHIMU
MATEVLPPEAPITTVNAASTSLGTNPTAATATATTTALVSAQPENAGPPPATTKRQRRPSVRLGEIGDQSATLSHDSHARRPKHSWRLPKDYSKSLKARSLTNLVHGNENSFEIQEPEEINQNGEVNLEFSHRKKAKRATKKRVRSNWIPKIDEGGGAERDSREDGGEGFRDFDPESDTPLKGQSPVNSVDDVALDFWHGGQRRTGTGMGRARVSVSRENEAMEMDNPRESDSRDPKCGISSSEGVRMWLIELGLSRYAPVFEIHEVDDEVLPLLTLEDLKDMGINAVGSRRKLYSAIQKLRKGFS